MKEWPKDNKTVSFTELVDSVTSAIRFCYFLRRRNRSKDFDYQGYTQGENEFACCLDPKTLFTAESLEYDKKHQGRDALEVAIAVAIQLGMEQGRRMERQKRNEQLDQLVMSMDLTKNILKGLK